MQLVKLETQQQFDELRKGDLVVVKWKPHSHEYKLAERQGAELKGHYIGHYSMVEVNRNNEIILRVRDNIYFIIDMYLCGESNAAEAYTLQG